MPEVQLKESGKLEAIDSTSEAIRANVYEINGRLSALITRLDGPREAGHTSTSDPTAPPLGILNHLKDITDDAYNGQLRTYRLIEQLEELF